MVDISTDTLDHRRKVAADHARNAYIRCSDELPGVSRVTVTIDMTDGSQVSAISPSTMSRLSVSEMAARVFNEGFKAYEARAESTESSKGDEGDDDVQVDVETLDRRNVDRLLHVAAQYKALYAHPKFRRDPVCRLARALAIGKLGPELADEMVVNGGRMPQDGAVPFQVQHQTPMGPMADFLAAGSRPRPVWLAWVPLAKACLAALDRNGDTISTPWDRLTEAQKREVRM